eukprot:gene10271-12598_t
MASFLNLIGNYIGNQTLNLWNAQQQRLIRFFINNHIKAYLQNPVQKEEFDTKFNQGNGSVILNDVVLDERVLNRKLVGLPVKFGTIRVKLIEFVIPITHITTDPIRIILKGIEVEMIPRVDASQLAPSSIAMSRSFSSSLSFADSSYTSSSEDEDDDEEVRESNRPVENTQVLSEFNQTIFKILSNVQVELDNISIFVTTLNNSLEVNISSASFSYEKIVDPSNQQLITIPKVLFDQLSVLLHSSSSGSAINLNQRHYLFACKNEKGEKRNEIRILSDPERHCINVDCVFNSVIKGNIDEGHVTGLMALVKKVTDSFQMLQNLSYLNDSKSSLPTLQKKSTPSKTTTPNYLEEENDGGDEMEIPMDMYITVSIPKISYTLNLPLFPDIEMTKPKFKVHVIGENFKIVHSKVYCRDLEGLNVNSGGVTTTDIQFDELTVDLLPSGTQEDKYNCLKITPYDGINPQITIVQKEEGTVSMNPDFKENLYLNENTFLDYKSIAIQEDSSISKANQLATCIINCILPEFNLKIYQSDYQCLLQSFNLSQQDATSTMVFTLTSLESRIKLILSNTNSEVAEQKIESFEIGTENINLFMASGYPNYKSSRTEKTVYGSSFIYMSLGSFDTNAIINSLQHMFFTNKTEFNGLDLITSSQEVIINNSEFQLKIGPICFIPSMNFINSFLDWFKIDEKVDNDKNIQQQQQQQQKPKQQQLSPQKQQLSSSSSSSLNNSKNNINNNNRLTENTIELVNCILQYSSFTTQLRISYDHLALSINPNGKTGTMLFTFNPIKISLRESNEKSFSYDMKDFQIIGKALQNLDVFFLYEEKECSKVEICNHEYEFTITKKIFNSLSVVFPQFLNSLSDLMIIKKTSKQTPETIVEFMNKTGNSGIGGGGLINILDEDYMGPSSVGEEEPILNGFEIIQTETKNAFKLIIVDIKFKIRFLSDDEKNNLTLKTHISEIVISNNDNSSSGNNNIPITSTNNHNSHSYDTTYVVNFKNFMIKDNVFNYYKYLFGPLSLYDDKYKKESFLSLVVSSREDNFKHNQQQQLQPPSPSLQPVPNNIYFDEFFVFPLQIKVDYKPASDVDNGSHTFTRGEYIWIFSMIPLSEANFTLPMIHLQSGKKDISMDQLVEEVGNIYTSHLFKKNIFQYLAGVSPIKICFKLGDSIAGLVKKPIQEARGPDGIVVGFGKGVGKSIMSVTTELLTASSKMTGVTSKLLGKFRNNNDQQQPHLPNQLNPDGSGNNDDLNYNRSIWVNQPETFTEGAKTAVSKVIGGFYNGVMGVVYQPFSQYQNEGTKAFLSSLFWSVPGLVVNPLVGITDGITSFSLGLRNSLDSSRIEREKLKYKKKSSIPKSPSSNKL